MISALKPWFIRYPPSAATTTGNSYLVSHAVHKDRYQSIVYITNIIGISVDSCPRIIIETPEIGKIVYYNKIISLHWYSTLEVQQFLASQRKGDGEGAEKPSGSNPRFAGQRCGFDHEGYVSIPVSVGMFVCFFFFGGLFIFFLVGDPRLR